MAFELDRSTQAKLAQAAKLVAEGEELARRCTNCGIDMSAQNAYGEALRQRIEAIQREFGTRRRD